MKITGMILVLFYIIMCTGWVKNVIKLSNCDFEAPYKAEIVHGVGLVPYVGMVTGWLEVGK